ncbi:MAG: nitrite reductase small subunit NirD [Abitibacteriaceae bacterium]|nr:nitrite reductase small subunit NirD [Abditibacteriaceae bacterium]
MSEFVTVAQCESLSDGVGECVRIGNKQIALFRLGEEFYAIDNECPHSGGPLCDGFTEGHKVMCPWHCWEFNITNGECLTVAGFDVESYPVRIENGTVQIQIEP